MSRARTAQPAPPVADAPIESEEANRRHLQTHIDRIVSTVRGEPFVQPAIDLPLDGPWVLEALVEVFGLSDFERDVLVLAAGAEIDPALRELLAGDAGCSASQRCTFGFALDRLAGAHWSALAPTAPLRRWRLVRTTGEPASIVNERIRIDDRVLVALLGVATVDPVLDAICRPLHPSEEPWPSTRRAAEELVRALVSGDGAPIQIVGGDGAARLDVAALAAARLGMRACTATAAALPGDARDLDEVVRLVERESFMSRMMLVVDVADADLATMAVVDRLVDRLGVCAVLSASEPLGRWCATPQSVELASPSHDELMACWEQVAAGEDVADAAFTFPIQPAAIRSVVADARADMEHDRELTFEHAVWSAARRRSRLSLDGLARRIDTVARWDDLVLPDTATTALQEMAAHVRQRRTVNHGWGFATHVGTSTAVTGLFHGPSGVGKTLAARVLAVELGLDLYVIDLSHVVSKYVGETEKHLREIFDRADRASCVLLFDEADALFGQRSEVSDAHDRYANIEVSYLLQRLESYRGLAVLTSNLPANIDHAFMRRLRYSVAFPFPDTDAREAIWRRAFPAGVPLKQIDHKVLARLSISGASIASIALRAAVLAADAGGPVTMALIQRAARTEYAKSDRQLTAIELQGFPA